MKYNGWANRQTWNVALWIGNLAREAGTYGAFVEVLADGGGPIAYQTPDGVAWNDSGLDLAALNGFIGEL